ncbi:MAG: LysR family transcriptional regulator [Clostridia bacterium]|nr:LysR family transcriptional regulator [Clostridia bacterium]
MEKNMDVTDYIYEVYKEKSFSLAAKKFFISQPALSAMVKKVEIQLGVTIFDRSTSPITLTEAGKIYIKSIEEMRSLKKRLQEELNDMGALKTGKLILSGENFVSSFIMPKIIMKFAEVYPGIKVELVESNSPDLRQLLLTDAIDLLVAHDFDSKLYSCEPLFDEMVILAVPKKLNINNNLVDCALSLQDLKTGRHNSASCPTVNLSAFKDEEFLILKKGNDMQRRAQILCENAGFTPNARIYLDQLITSYNMACAGMGIAFVTDILATSANGENCVYYKIKGEDTTRRMYIGYKRNRYISKACSAFINTAKEVFFANLSEK